VRVNRGCPNEAAVVARAALKMAKDEPSP